MIKLKEYKFDELYEISSGITSKPDQAGKGFPFLSFETVFNNQFLPEKLSDLMDTNEEVRKSYSIKKGDIFLTRTSETVDELAMSSVAYKDYPNATYSGFLKRLRPKEKNDELSYYKYIAFYLRSSLFRKTIDNNTVMTLRASFNEDIFSYLKIHLPDFDIQKKIGDFLFNINKKIIINKKSNDIIEKQINEIYKYWFIQFDFPNNEKKPYKSSNGKMIYNNAVKREIPINWKVENLKNNSLTSLIKTGIKNFSDDKIYLATADVDQTMMNLYSQKIKYNKKPSRANMQPIENSVWFAKMKNSKKNMFVGKYSKFLINNVIFSTGFIGLKCKNYSSEYIWSFVLNENFEIIKDNLAASTTQKAINNDALEYINLIVPDDETLKKFNLITKNLFKKIYLNKIENYRLEQLRDWILPAFINGRAKII